MTRTAPRALSLQNYWENLRMRAVRDGASRAGKSRPDLLGSRTALQRWSYDKMLIDWVRSGRTGKYLALGHGARTSLRSVHTPWPRAKYFPVRPSYSVNKYIMWETLQNRDFDTEMASIKELNQLPVPARIILAKNSSLLSLFMEQSFAGTQIQILEASKKTTTVYTSIST